MENNKKMKKLFLIGLLFIISCSQPGTTYEKLSSNEEDLPVELKGLKIYLVKTYDSDFIYVAVLNNEINSLTSKKGKQNQTVIMINNKMINVRKILSENDSIIVALK